MAILGIQTKSGLEFVGGFGGGGSDGKVAVDSGATADFLGAAAGDGALRVGSSLSYADGGNFVTLGVDESNVDHDALNNFVADEHVAHTGVSFVGAISSGISGGGDISASRNFGIDIDDLNSVIGSIVAADKLMMWDATDSATKKIAFSQFESDLDHDVLSNFVADEHVAHTGVTITGLANSGITGGGDISVSRELGFDLDDLASLVGGIMGEDQLLMWDATDSTTKKVLVSQLEDDLDFLKNVVEDLSPQLGANLDSNGFDILLGGNKLILDTGEEILANANAIELHTLGSLRISLGTTLDLRDAALVSTTGSVIVNDTFNVTGAATLDSTLQLGGDLSSSGSTLTIADNVIVGGNLGITGDIKDANGDVILVLTEAGGTVVNWVSIKNAPTLGAPLFIAKGSDTNIDLAFNSKGTGIIDLRSSTDVTGDLQVSDQIGFGGGGVVSGAFLGLDSVTGGTHTKIGSFKYTYTGSGVDIAGLDVQLINQTTVGGSPKSTALEFAVTHAVDITGTNEIRGVSGKVALKSNQTVTNTIVVEGIKGETELSSGTTATSNTTIQAAAIHGIAETSWDSATIDYNLGLYIEGESVFTDDVLILSDKKLNLEGSGTTPGDTYIDYVSGTSTLEMVVGGNKIIQLTSSGVNLAALITNLRIPNKQVAIGHDDIGGPHGTVALDISGLTTPLSQCVLSTFSNLGPFPSLILRRGRGTRGTPTVTFNNNFTGKIESGGYDGAAFQDTAAIVFRIDGTPASNSVPIEMLFETSPDTTANRAIRMKIAPGGKITIAGELELDGDFNHDGTNLGLYAATPVAQQTITGARDEPEGALADLLTKLALTGIFIDSTTAS